MNHNSKKPTIELALNGPYLVRNLDDLKNSRGEAIEVKPMMALCRCGKSSNKPFCDGSYTKVAFSGEKAEERVSDRGDNYEGKEITMVRQF